MKPLILVVEMILFSAILLLSVLYQSQWGFTVSILFQILPAVMLRDKFQDRRWLQPIWLFWSGASFVAAGWLQKSEGLQVEPVFSSFGPGYLIMGVLAVVWPRWFYGEPTQGAKS